MTFFLFVIAEERQDQNAKRRKVEQAARAAAAPVHHPSFPKAEPKSIHPSLPARPSFDTFAAPSAQKINHDKAFKIGSKALGGSNSDIVANRSAIRMANMTAAEALKAELAGLKPLKPKGTTTKPAPPMAPPPNPTQQVHQEAIKTEASVELEDEGGIPGLDNVEEIVKMDSQEEGPITPIDPSAEDSEVAATVAEQDQQSPASSVGTKRKFDEIDSSTPDGEIVLVEDEDATESAPAKKRIVHADGTVESEDTVR